MLIDQIHIMEKCIGRGAFGTVHVGVDAESGQQVAVKSITFPSSGAQSPTKALNETTAEIVLMRQLDHPNIVKYIGAKRSDMTLHIFMEIITGGSLAVLIRSMGTLSNTLCRKIMKDVLSGLDYLHCRSICHRDLKADNVLLTSDGTAKLGDFGTSKHIQMCFSLCSGLKSICGTPWYMAPEIINGEEYGLPVDIWAAGGILYECLYGKHPYHEYQNIHAAMFYIASKKAPPSFTGDVSEGAVEFMVNCFKATPRDRMRADELLHTNYILGIEPEENPEGVEEIEDFSPTPLLESKEKVWCDFSQIVQTENAASSPTPYDDESFASEGEGEGGGGGDGIKRCDVCCNAIAVFLCSVCKKGVANTQYCGVCWEEQHSPEQKHRKTPLLFHPSWTQSEPSEVDLSPLVDLHTTPVDFSVIGSDDGTVLFSPGDIGKGGSPIEQTARTAGRGFSDLFKVP